MIFHFRSWHPQAMKEICCWKEGMLKKKEWKDNNIECLEESLVNCRASCLLGAE